MDRISEFNSLVEQRATLWAQADEMAKRDGLSADESAVLAKAVDDIRQLDARIATLENEIKADSESTDTETDAVAQEDLAGAVRSLPPAPKMMTPRAPAYVRDYNDRTYEANRSMAFRGWIMNAAGKCTDAHRKAARAVGFDLNQRSITVNLSETRAAGDPMSTQAAGKGKEFVPVEFSTNYINKVNYICPIRQYSNVLNTSTGHKIEVPVVADAMKGQWISENDAKPLSEFASANLTLSSYKVVSGVVKISEEMLRDSGIPLAKIVGEALATRIGRSQEEKFLVGSGTNEPQGVVTGATGTLQTAAAGALTVNDLLGLMYSVDPIYRQGGVFVVSDSTLAALHAARLTSQGEPAFVTDYMNPTSPMKLFGHDIVVSNAMASGTGTGTVCAVFGDLKSFFMIRDVQSVELRVTTELYFLNNQVGFLAEAFCDSRVLNGDAIKKLAYK